MKSILLGGIFAFLLILIHSGEFSPQTDCGGLDKCRAGATGGFWKCGDSELKSNSHLLWAKFILYNINHFIKF